MAEEDVDDIFKDFETKVEDKEETAEEKELSEEELLKRKYQKAEQALKEKHRKEKEALAEKRKKKMTYGETPTKAFPNIEKIAYVAIILVLAAYIIIDWSYYHGEKTVNLETDQTITAAAVQVQNETDKIKEVVEDEIVEEEPEEEEKELSGVIALGITKIYTEIIDEDEDLGEISKIVFIIDNGKDKVLTPVVNVYVYDDEMDEKWETWDRADPSPYTYKVGIPSGKTHTGFIDLSPKKFRNLDLKKNVRLTLNDTEDGFIKAVNQKVLIE
ncbi:hypothetical protein ACFLUF_02800 [Chloroflexota bacterium]